MPVRWKYENVRAVRAAIVSVNTSSAALRHPLNQRVLDLQKPIEVQLSVESLRKLDDQRVFRHGLFFALTFKRWHRWGGSER